MALTFVSHQTVTSKTEDSAAFDGSNPTIPSGGFAKTVTAVGTKVINATTTPNRVAQATIKVTGSTAENAVTTIDLSVTPPISASRPLTEDELAAYNNFIDDAVTAKATVESGITW